MIADLCSMLALSLEFLFCLLCSILEKRVSKHLLRLHFLRISALE